MLDHITISVTDFPKAKTFYDDALGTLGVACFYSDGKTAAGYGTEAIPYFWIGLKDVVQSGTHVAFSAPDRATVERFYRAALQAGGRDNGAPGLRRQYGPTYYGAFVLDSDGHNIEAVCRAAE